MITTITTATTAAMTPSTAASLALIAILFLISLLIQKGLINGLEGARAVRMGRILNIGIMPLVVVFVTTIVSRVVEVLH
jgi:hypothetical protein